MAGVTSCPPSTPLPPHSIQRKGHGAERIAPNPLVFTPCPTRYAIYTYRFALCPWRFAFRGLPAACPVREGPHSHGAGCQLLHHSKLIIRYWILDLLPQGEYRISNIQRPTSNGLCVAVSVRTVHDWIFGYPLGVGHSTLRTKSGSWRTWRLGEREYWIGIKIFRQERRLGGRRGGA